MQMGDGLEVALTLTFPIGAVLLSSRVFYGRWVFRQTRFALFANSFLYFGLAAFFYFFIRLADTYLINYCSAPQNAYALSCDEALLAGLWWLASYPYRAPFWVSAVCVSVVLMCWGLRHRHRLWRGRKKA